VKDSTTTSSRSGHLVWVPPSWVGICLARYVARGGESDWTGWWGEEPPFHHPVFVLTHEPRAPIEMRGGTTFYFVNGGTEAALSAAFEAAGDRDVLVGGGAATIRQYLRASLIDEMHMAIVPVLLGSGERLFDDLGPSTGNYRCVEHVCSPDLIHVRIARAGRGADGGLQG